MIKTELITLRTPGKLSPSRLISPFARTRVHACSFRGDRAPAAHFREPQPREAPGDERKGCTLSPSLSSRSAPPANTRAPCRCIPSAKRGRGLLRCCFLSVAFWLRWPRRLPRRLPFDAQRSASPGDRSSRQPGRISLRRLAVCCFLTLLMHSLG